ncbi:MAG: PfkB family carbohydrate kinase [Chloroflexota bacterium]|nr:PfkB family carbohydrate kinase [Chloroflexota bacterium]
MSKDLHEAGAYALGGTATYAGLLGARLGLRTAIVTSCGPDLEPLPALDGISIVSKTSPSTTTFRNLYDGAFRRQIISGVAAPLTAADVPAEWRESRVALLGPVAGEITNDLFKAFGASLLGVTPQGMMRAWNDAGEVYAVPWEPDEDLLRRVDVLVLSEDDLATQSTLERLLRTVRIVALTHEARGATVYVDGTPRTFPAYASSAVEPTGAGDTFAAAFLVELEATKDIERAAHFANCAASLVIEGEGTSTVPTRAQIEQRIGTGLPHER